MPENTNYGGGDDMYADAAPATAARAEKPSESDTEGETALLPKSLCPGMSPGDEIVLKIVRALDDQYEVAYSKGPEEEEEEPESTPTETAARAEMPGEMASLME